MSGISSKVLRAGCMGAALGGIVGLLFGGALPCLIGPNPPWQVMLVFGLVVSVPGVLLGVLVGAISAAKALREAELATLKKRVEELEAKASQGEAERPRDEGLFKP